MLGRDIIDSVVWKRRSVQLPTMISLFFVRRTLRIILEKEECFEAVKCLVVSPQTNCT